MNTNTRRSLDCVGIKGSVLLETIFDTALTFFRKGLMFFDNGRKLHEVG